MIFLALAGCTVGGLPPVEDRSLTEGQRNIAAIRAILAQPPYTSAGVPAENAQRGSADHATCWPPEWLVSFVSPGPVEPSTTAVSSESAAPVR